MVVAKPRSARTVRTSIPAALAFVIAPSRRPASASAERAAGVGQQHARLAGCLLGTSGDLGGQPVDRRARAPAAAERGRDLAHAFADRAAPVTKRRSPGKPLGLDPLRETGEAR